MKNKGTKEIIMYLIFGVLTTIVSWGSYTLFVNAIRLSVFWSNLFSWICAVTFAYVTNKLWVFESKSWSSKILVKEIATFFASRGVTGIIEIVCVPLLEKTIFDELFYGLLEGTGISGIASKILFTDGIYSKIIVSFIIVILNYVFSKLIVFKKSAEE